MKMELNIKLIINQKGVNMSQKKIAEHLGISTAAVSNILRGKGRFSDKTKGMVLDKLREFGLRPKFVSRPVICLHDRVLPDDAHTALHIFNYFNGIRVALSREDMETRIDFIHCRSDSPDRFMERTARMIDSHNPSGVILDSNIQCCEDIARMISGKKINTIIFGHERDFQEFSTVMTDSFNGALDAVKYLIDKGHTRIGTIRWNSSGTPNSIKKFSAYKCALAERNIPFNPDYVVEAVSSNSKLDDVSKRPGRDALARLFRQAGKNPPTAIFIENSFVSHSLLYPLKADHGKLPGEIMDTEFIHFEDTNLSATAQIMSGRLNYDEPSLQCCHIDWEKMGRIAGDLMIRMIKGGDSSIHSIRIKPELKCFHSGKMYPLAGPDLPYR